MSDKQKMTWDGDAFKKLLLAILKVSEAKPDFNAVAEELTTDTIVCTPRAVQEQLKKLRKIAQSEPGSATPTKSPKTDTPTKAKAPRKAPATPTGGVKKTRKPAATGGRGKKAKSAAAVDAEDTPVKVEAGSDDGMDASSDVGEGFAVGSDQAQAGLDEEFFA